MIATIAKTLCRLALAVVFGCGWDVSFARAQEAPLEYQVKASYLYNFIRFTTWPPDVLSANGKLNLCVSGAERFGSSLDSLANETVEGRLIAVYKMTRTPSLPSGHCHVLFLGIGDARALAATIPIEHGVLTVSEIPGFAARGGVINLIEQEGRIRFEVNQQAAKQAGLVLSSRLLRLAAVLP